MKQLLLEQEKAFQPSLCDRRGVRRRLQDLVPSKQGQPQRGRKKLHQTRGKVLSMPPSLPTALWASLLSILVRPTGDVPVSHTTKGPCYATYVFIPCLENALKLRPIPMECSGMIMSELWKHRGLSSTPAPTFLSS